MVSKEEFFNLLANYDYYYSMSDDFQQYERGANQSRQIEKVLAAQPEFKPIYDAWMEYLGTPHYAHAELGITRPELSDFADL